MSPDTRPAITKLLRDWQGGDQNALDSLIPLIYQELRTQADHYMNLERPDHTLQPTALVHEAFLRMVDASVPWQDKAHFMAVAARTMRRILVDHARSHQRVKRGGAWARKTLTEGLALSQPPPLDLIILDDALTRFSSQDDRAARAAELHYFGGLSYEDTAEVLGISPATVHRDLRIAKAWLMKELTGENPDP